MKWTCLLSALLGCCASAVHAAEPNETFATATLLAPAIRSVSDSLTPGLPPDTLLGIRDFFGGIVASDDDSSPIGSGTASGLFNVPTDDGAINFVVTGCCDFEFHGDHDISGSYRVFVDVYDDFQVDPIASFSAVRTLQPDALHEFSFFDEDWLFGTYDVYIDNTIGPESRGDIDFFTFTGLTAGQAFTAQTLAPGMPTVDTLLGWFNATGGLLTSDNDGGTDLLSKITGTVPANGQLTFAVTGVGDDDFTGLHTEQFNYQLAVTLGSGLPGDFNNDTMVNGQDLAVWRANFGQTAAADADGDSDTDGHDFLIWQRRLGSSASVAAAASVPEPHAGTLFAVASAGLFRRLRR
jgi:hypothetical protein